MLAKKNLEKKFWKKNILTIKILDKKFNEEILKKNLEKKFWQKKFS